MNRELIFKVLLFANVGLVALGASILGRPSSASNLLSARIAMTSARHSQLQGLNHFCNDSHSRQVNMLTSFIEAELDLTGEQTESLTQLKESFKTSAIGSFESVCRQVNLADAEALPAPEKLNQLQAAMLASSEVIEQVQPAFDTFYTSLNPEQQQTLNTPPNQWHRRWHERREGE